MSPNTNTTPPCVVQMQENKHGALSTPPPCGLPEDHPVHDWPLPRIPGTPPTLPSQRHHPFRAPVERDSPTPAAPSEKVEGWREFDGDGDTLPGDGFFLAVGPCVDEYGEEGESAPVLVSLEPHTGTLYHGDNTLCWFRADDIIRWAPSASRPAPDLAKAAEVQTLHAEFLACPQCRGVSEQWRGPGMCEAHAAKTATLLARHFGGGE